MKSQKNFIDFVTDVQENPEILNEFVNVEREEGKYLSFFRKHGYGVSLEECSKMLACLIGGMSLHGYIDSY